MATDPAVECHTILYRWSAEFIGTLWLVLVLDGCGAAVLAAKLPDGGIGLTGVWLAFGLTAVNPARSTGPALFVGGWVAALAGWRRLPAQSSPDSSIRGWRERRGRSKYCAVYTNRNLAEAA